MRNYKYQFLNFVWSYGYHLKKQAEFWELFSENIAKLLGGRFEINKIRNKNVKYGNIEVLGKGQICVLSYAVYPNPPW